eukprot:2533679-Prymnesium_polylepis.1
MPSVKANASAQLIHQPDWLVRFHDKRLADADEQHLARGVQRRASTHGVGILGYGLIRSTAMLEATADAMHRKLAAILAPNHGIFVHGYCAPPSCSPAAVDRLLRRLEPRHNFFALRLEPRHNRSRPLDDHVACARAGAGPLSSHANYEAATHSLHVAYTLAVARQKARGAAREWECFVLWRIDTLLLSPVFDYWLNRPWQQPRALFVPALQVLCTTLAR